MKYVFLLCLLFAVTAISVTATVCAVIGTFSLIESLWNLLVKAVRWVAGQIRDEKRQIEQQEASETRREIKVTHIRDGLKHQK